MPRRALLSSGVVLVVALAVVVLPWLSRERLFPTSTPVPPSLFTVTDVALRQGQRLCVAPVVVARRTGLAHLQVRDPTFGGPRLLVTVSGRGYSSSAVVHGGYGVGVLSARLAPPARDVVTRLCVTDRGPGPVAFAGTLEPRHTRTSVDGRRIAANPALTLTEPAARSIARRATDVLAHMTAFRPAFLSPALVGVLIAAFLVLVVAGVPWAYARALAADSSADATSAGAARGRGLSPSAGRSTSRQDPNAST